MSLIEKAVARLDQLKRAGVDLPTEKLPTLEVPPVEPVKAAASNKAAQPIAPVAVSMPSPASGAESTASSKPVSIDLARLESLGMVNPLNARALIAEEYRLIKRPLLRNVDEGGSGSHPNLIMVTSALPGEGKSFSAINLAVSMAMELDRTVLLVDADVSRPSVLNHLGLPPSRGLMDILLSPDMPLSDVMLRTNIEKLSILPAGMPHARATELLASEAMERLLDQLATRYEGRVVIFDSPPLLLTTEARVLASCVGQVVVVVESEKTTQSLVKQALATIEHCPIKMMLLNKVRDTGPTGQYGYYTPL